MAQNTKMIGYFLVGFSIVLLIVLILVKINDDTKSAALCELYTEQQLDMSTCPAHQTNTSWLIVSAFGIAFLVFGIGAYLLIISRPSSEKKDFKAVDASKLDEDEKKVYDIVKGKNGSAYQSDLIKETGLSKVKVTRILDKLETNGIIERKRRGMTNIVVLK